MELTLDDAFTAIDELKKNQFLVNSVLAMSFYEAMAKQPSVDSNKLQADLVRSFEMYRDAFKDRQFAHDCLSALSENMRDYDKI
ncbi:MAG TPA: hypothetical protein VNI56_02660 [Xanthomonadaceae bacterium]|nr:hypothetical protein [Xanthomonadaceae bacterium]